MTIFLCLYPPSMVTVYLRLSIEEACIKAHTLTPHMGMVWVGLICSFTFQSEMVVLRCKVSLRHQYHYVPTNPIARTDRLVNFKEACTRLGLKNCGRARQSVDGCCLYSTQFCR